MPRLRPPYVAQVGLFGRPTLEHNMETLFWVRDLLERGAEWFAHAGRNGRKGLRSFSVSGRVKKPGVHLAPAGITVKELIDEFCGGMLDGHELYAYLPGRRLGRHPARVDGRHPARLRHAPAPRLLHRLGGGDHPVAARQRARRGAEPDALLRARVLRPVHAVPRGHREGRAPDGSEEVGQRTCSRSCRVAMADASICGLGQAAPNPIRCVAKHFPHEVGLNRVSVAIRRDERICMKMNEPVGAETIEFKLNGETISAFAGETIIQAAERYGVDIPHLCYKEGYRRRRQLPRLRGRDQGRARAGAVVLPRARQGHGGRRATRRARCTRRRWWSSCCCPTCRRRT